MRSSFSFPPLPRRKRNLPAAELLDAMIGLAPDPAFFVEHHSGQILLANEPALELSGYSRADLEHLNLAMLFPETDWNQTESSLEKWSRLLSQPLQKRDGSIVDVHLNHTIAGPEAKWDILTLEPTYILEEQQAALRRKTEVWELLRDLATTPQYAEQPDILPKALQIGSSLCQASVLAIYQGDGENYILKRQCAYGKAESLPDQVHPQDLISLKSPQIWTPGKRSQSSLHRAARAANLAFLASAPLGQPNALVGLLVMAGEQAPYNDDVAPMLQVIAATLTSILQHQAVISNLQKNLQRYLREAAISTAVRESATDGILLIDPDFCIRELNPAAEGILGYTNREVRGFPYQNMLVGADDLIPPLISDRQEPNLYDAGNVKLYRRDGVMFQAHVLTLAIWVENRLETYVMLIRDLSEQEQYQIRNQQLEQQALLGEFSAIFAHEVRNPINNISTGLELMAYNLPEDHPNQEVITRLRQDCDRLAELMKSVLAFGKPMEYKMEAMDLGNALRKILERWHMQMKRVNIQHHIQVDPGTPPVEGDQRALEQVWNNLISNAIQAMSPQGAGTLTVRVRSITGNDRKRWVEVSITDTGLGIPQEIRERIFEPFFTTKHNGTGLGLAITKRIVNTHKGTINVTSIPGGTAFSVQLPVANVPASKVS